jgi:hypothetical protein
MGLDITHYKLSLSPNDKGNQCTIEDWDLDCNVSLKHYSKYITDIWEYDFDKAIAIVKNEQVLENLKKSELFDEKNLKKVFVGSINSKMRADISRYIKTEKLDKLEMLECKTTTNGIKYREIAFGKKVIKKGFYYDEVGNQCRGMNNYFYDNFRKYLFWGEKKDFDLAYECVGGDFYIDCWGQEAVDEMKAKFKADFVDKFVFGQSILCASF